MHPDTLRPHVFPCCLSCSLSLCLSSCPPRQRALSVPAIISALPPITTEGNSSGVYENRSRHIWPLPWMTKGPKLNLPQKKKCRAVHCILQIKLKSPLTLTAGLALQTPARAWTSKKDFTAVQYHYIKHGQKMSFKMLTYLLRTWKSFCEWTKIDQHFSALQEPSLHRISRCSVSHFHFQIKKNK